MNKLSLLLATAILGTSSLALADHASAPGTAPAPIDVRDHRFDDGDLDGRAYTSDGDRRFRDDDAYELRDGRWARRPAMAWEHLGTVGAGKAVLNLRDHDGRFRRLKLDVHGRMRIHRVVILFGNGTRQVMSMRSMVNRNMAAPIIDLGGPRKIRALVIYSSPWSRGTVSVTGLQARQLARRF